jgi:group II intron reverse transcriptase/maturase
LRSETVSTKLDRIAEQAVQNPEMQFTTLAHLIDEEFLREAFGHTKKKAAAGVDDVTAEEYAEALDANIAELYQRMRSGRYKAPPVRRVWLEKEDGKQRPIGIPALEDKILQRAVTMLLEAIYEQVFYACSHGFRRKKSAHHALREIRENCMNMGIRWILDADIKGYFDSIRRDILREFLRKKMNDGTIIRFIGKWLNAGVMEEGKWTSSETGTPQGGVVSPMLSNVFLHYVLDEWFEQEIKPRLKGRCFLSRFADDFVIGFELESDARRVMEVLPKRFNRFGLTIHPTKTKLIEFGRPNREQTSGKGKGTFDFLGFTHYWARSRRGYWVIKRKTKRKKMQAANKAIWQWCKWNRHMPIREQWQKLCQKLRGHYQYFGIRGNSMSMERYRWYTRMSWKHWLGHRHRSGNISWEAFDAQYGESFPLPMPRIVHNV